MTINCEVFLRWDATAGEQRALGAALWGWCTSAAGEASIYPHLDNQGLADLLAGRLPAPGPLAPDGRLPYVQLAVPGDPARDQAAVLEGLRGALPKEGLAGIRVQGLSWRMPEVPGQPAKPAEGLSA